jgi:hypothetical protein
LKKQTIRNKTGAAILGDENDLEMGERRPGSGLFLGGRQ